MPHLGAYKLIWIINFLVNGGKTNWGIVKLIPGMQNHNDSCICHMIQNYLGFFIGYKPLACWIILNCAILMAVSIIKSLYYKNNKTNNTSGNRHLRWESSLLSTEGQQRAILIWSFTPNQQYHSQTIFDHLKNYTKQ